MSAETLIKEIISLHPEVSREQILERLGRERKKTGGLISDEVLLRMIATDFGVEISVDETLNHTVSLKDLVPSLNDVTVVGRVVAVFTPKTFAGRRSGKFASLMIADENDILRVVLWNDKTNLIELGRIKAGQIVRFSHGYTREDRNGGVELHIGDKCEVEIDPKDVDAKDYPTISKFATKIGDVTHINKNRNVNVTGTVKELFQASAFTRQDSSSGKVMRLTLADETGEVPVVVWNEKAEELEKSLKKGDFLQIVHGKMKKALNGAYEIHVDGATYVETSVPKERFSKIADLTEESAHVNVEGEVISQPMLRNVKTRRGELVRLAVFELKDETGRIWVSAWRTHANSTANLKTGDKIIIKNVYVKKGFADQLELSTKDTTRIMLRSRNE